MSQLSGDLGLPCRRLLTAWPKCQKPDLAGRSQIWVGGRQNGGRRARLTPPSSGSGGYPCGGMSTSGGTCTCVLDLVRTVRPRSGLCDRRMATLRRTYGERNLRGTFWPMGNFTVYCLGYRQLYVELCGLLTKFTGNFLGHGHFYGELCGLRTTLGGTLLGLCWLSPQSARKVPAAQACRVRGGLRRMILHLRTKTSELQLHIFSQLVSPGKKFGVVATK